MIYSVWNQAERRYDYYATPDKQKTANTPKARHIRPAHALGVPPEAAAWPLPAGARLIGHGDYARGRIASRGGQALGFLPVDISLNKILLLFGAWVAWTVIKRDR